MLIQCAWIHVPSDTTQPILAFVPRPEWIRSDAYAPLAEAVLATWHPTSLTIVHAYVPSLYLVSSATDAGDAPVRALVQCPKGRARPSWPLDRVVPWGVPNTISGGPAAFFAEAMTVACPVLLLALPTRRPQPHTTGQHRANVPTIPYEAQHMDDAEATQRLVQRAEAVDTVKWASLLPPSVPSDGRPGLVQVAVQYALDTKAAHEAGHVGDGGMYL